MRPINPSIPERICAVRRLVGRTALALLLAADARATEDLRTVAAAPVLAAASQRIELPARNVAIERKVVDSGPGWVNEQFAGHAGSLQLTDAADYFIVAGTEGIDAVPLHQVVGTEFGAYVRDAMRTNASKSLDPLNQVFVLQKSTLQEIEPLWLDRERLQQDPYEPLDRTICLPMPFVGASLAPNFAPEIVIRELTDGTLEYREPIGPDVLSDLGPTLGSVQLNLQPVATSVTPAIAQTSALAQSFGTSSEMGSTSSAATSGGGKTCFTLRDLLLANGSDGICSFDPLDPSSWYSEPVFKGTLDLRPPPFEEEVSLDTTYGLGKTLLGSVYDGTMRFALDFGFTSPDTRRGIGGSIKVKVGLLFCVPLWVRPVAGRLWGHLQASRDIEMNGTLSVGATQAAQVGETSAGTAGLGRDSSTGGAWGSQLPDPQKVFDHTLPTPAVYYAIPWSAGPVPILLILDAPIEIGLDATLETPMVTNFKTSSGVRMGFDYACSFSGGCEEKEEPYFEPWSWIDLGSDAGVEGRIELKPYAGISLRASLYWPGVLYAKVGPRAFLNLDFWGASKTCGDADANGSQEHVTGLALDQDLGLELLGTVGLYEPLTSDLELNFLLDVIAPISIPLVERIFHGSFINLHQGAVSKAFQPMLVGPGSVVEDSPPALQARMRPCYPYEDDVEYDLRWAMSSVDTIEGDPMSDTSASHTYANPGAYTATLTAVRDTHGRVFAEAERDPLTLAVQRPITVTAKPTVKWTAPTPVRLR